MEHTKYLIKFTNLQHFREYLEWFNAPSQTFLTTKLPSRGRQFDSWTEAQRIAFELRIDTVTEILPANNLEPNFE